MKRVPEVETIGGVIRDNRCPKCDRPFRLPRNLNTDATFNCPHCGVKCRVNQFGDELGPQAGWTSECE